MWEEERNYLEFVINQIKAMQNDIRESEVRLDENKREYEEREILKKIIIVRKW